jgi:hypothetical protein
MKRVIYCLKDPVTKKVVYIGQTINSLNRMNEHCWGQTTMSKERLDWGILLKKQQLKPIFEIIDTANNKADALVKEKKYIIFYSTTNKLFNKVGCKTLKQYNKSGELVAEYIDKKEATEKTGIKGFHIGRGLDYGFLFSWSGFDKTFFDKEKKFKKARIKKVLQLDKNGILVKQFEGVRSAGRETGINYKSIAAVAGGSNIRKSAGGFKWLYI